MDVKIYIAKKVRVYKSSDSGDKTFWRRERLSDCDPQESKEQSSQVLSGFQFVSNSFS